MKTTLLTFALAVASFLVSISYAAFPPGTRADWSKLLSP